MPDGRQHRVQRKRYEQRDQHRDRDRDTELEKELADDAAHERNRQEHGDDGEGCCHDCQADFLRCLERGLNVALAHGEVPHDVFAHDDRVIDQDTDRKR